MIVEANTGYVSLIPGHWDILFGAPPGMKLEVGTQLVQTMEEMGIATSDPFDLRIYHSSDIYKGISGIARFAEQPTSRFACKRGLGDTIDVWVCDPKVAPKKHLHLFCQSNLLVDVMASAILVHELTHCQQLARLGREQYLLTADDLRQKHETEAKAAEDDYVRAFSSGKTSLLLRFL